MDGMFYRRENEDQFREQRSVPSVAPLLLITGVVVLVVLGALVMMPHNLAEAEAAAYSSLGSPL